MVILLAWQTPVKVSTPLGVGALRATGLMPSRHYRIIGSLMAELTGLPANWRSLQPNRRPLRMCRPARRKGNGDRWASLTRHQCALPTTANSIPRPDQAHYNNKHQSLATAGITAIAPREAKPYNGRLPRRTHKSS